MSNLSLRDLPTGAIYSYKDKRYSVEIDVEQVLNPGGPRCRNCCFTKRNCSHYLNVIFGTNRNACDISNADMPRVFKEVKEDV